MSENCQHFVDGYTILMSMNTNPSPIQPKQAVQPDEHARRYAAVQSRDERFDGLFFTGVLTTGIFCRPVCPAKTPRTENVRFFSTAAAAANAGFRPCLRCRPEAAPESPEWNWPSTVVSRAVRLIADGALEEQGVDDLAAQLHLSARQLRRYFASELGVPPIKVAQTQRLLFAKQLITETTLPMTEIAFAAGYSSLRRFNDALRETYRRPPTALRRNYKEHERAEVAAASQLTLKLGYRPPYDWPAMLAARQRQALPGVERVDAEGVYQRAVCFGKQVGVIAVQPVPTNHHVLLHVPTQLAPHLRTIVARIKRMFDLRADPAAIAAHLEADQGLVEQVAGRPTPRLPSAWDAREAAVQIVLGQAVGAGRAAEILHQITVKHGVVVVEAEHHTVNHHTVNEGERLHAVPAREAFGRALLDFDLPSATVALLRQLMRNDTLHAASTIEETVAQLREEATDHAIDAATAHAIALHGLGEPDALPTDDAALVQRAASWRPWRSYGWLLVSTEE